MKIVETNVPGQRSIYRRAQFFMILFEGQSNKEDNLNHLLRISHSDNIRFWQYETNNRTLYDYYLFRLFLVYREGFELI